MVFRKKSASESELSEEMKAQLGFLKQLEAHFSQEQLDRIMQILQAFAEEPKQIQVVYELLEIKTNEKV